MTTLENYSSASGGGGGEREKQHFSVITNDKICAIMLPHVLREGRGKLCTAANRYK